MKIKDKKVMDVPRKKMKKLFNEQASHTPEITTFKQHHIHLVDVNNTQSLDLLRQAYTEVYEPAFPIVEEREEFETLVENMTDANRSLDTVIIILGEDLDTDKPVIKGLSVAYYYNKEDVGLLANYAISSGCRSHGLGRAIVDATKQTLLDIAKSKGAPLKGIFLECNDPAKVTAAEDSMDPVVRLQTFQHWGGKIMPIDYIQPPLAKGAAKCTTLKLLAYPHPETGEYPKPEGIKAFIKGIYTELARYAGCLPHVDPDYIKTMKQIDALKKTPPSSGLPKPPRS